MSFEHIVIVLVGCVCLSRVCCSRAAAAWCCYGSRSFHRVGVGVRSWRHSRRCRETAVTGCRGGHSYANESLMLDCVAQFLADFCIISFCHNSATNSFYSSCVRQTVIHCNHCQFGCFINYWHIQFHLTFKHETFPYHTSWHCEDLHFHMIYPYFTNAVRQAHAGVGHLQFSRIPFILCALPTYLYCCY